MRDILDRLRADAGQLTVAALIQEREAAATEIERLRETIERLRSNKTPPKSPPQQAVSKQQRPVPPVNPDALVRLERKVTR